MLLQLYMYIVNCMYLYTCYQNRSFRNEGYSFILALFGSVLVLFWCFLTLPFWHNFHINFTIFFASFRIIQDTPAGTLQRKKSLPDVQALDVTTKSQGSKAMTREEISVLSSARRETVRRQLEEVERYKSNPLLYLLNPRVTVSHSDFFTCTLREIRLGPLSRKILWIKGCFERA